MTDVENKSFEFITTWSEVLAKLSSLQDLLSVKMVVIFKSPSDPKNVEISKRDDVSWYKGVPFICIASSVYGCVQDNAKSNEMKTLNPEWKAAIESVRVYIKHVLTFPEFKVDPRTNELMREAVTGVVKEKLKTSNLVIEETYMYSTELPPMDQIVEYSNSKSLKDGIGQLSVAKHIESRRKNKNEFIALENKVTKFNYNSLERCRLKENTVQAKHKSKDKAVSPRVVSPVNEGSNKQRLDESSSKGLHSNGQDDLTTHGVEVIPSDAVEVSEIDIAEFMSGLGEIVFVADGKEEEVMSENSIENLMNVRVERVVESISLENMNRLDDMPETNSLNQLSYSSSISQHNKDENSVQAEPSSSLLKRKCNPDDHNHYLVNLAKKMASDFCQLSSERKKVFREKTIHLLKSLVDEQEVEDAVISTLKPEHMKYCKSGNAFFLNGQLYKFV